MFPIEKQNKKRNNKKPQKTKNHPNACILTGYVKLFKVLVLHFLEPKMDPFRAITKI